MKLACVTLSWSARSLDKTACWPIKLRGNFIHVHSSFQCIQFCMFHAIMTLKVWVSITAEVSPQTRHKDLPFTFTKKNSFVYLSLKERNSAPTFHESPLVVVTCQSLRTRRDETTRDDRYAEVVFNDLGHGPERQTLTNCTFENVFPELIFSECITDCLAGRIQPGGRRFSTLL